MILYQQYKIIVLGMYSSHKKHPKVTLPLHEMERKGGNVS